jgi:hypothetical protein
MGTVQPASAEPPDEPSHEEVVFYRPAPPCTPERVSLDELLDAGRVPVAALPCRAGRLRPVGYHCCTDAPGWTCLARGILSERAVASRTCVFVLGVAVAVGSVAFVALTGLWGVAFSAVLAVVLFGGRYIATPQES